MYLHATLLILALFGLILLLIPRPLLRAYRRSFSARHGVLFQLGLTVLTTLTLSTLVVTLRNPGAAPVMERVNAAVVLATTILGTWDLRRYSARRRRESGQQADKIRSSDD